jgi:CubicO group peptidase (beta-lactamase class C family)
MFFEACAAKDPRGAGVVVSLMALFNKTKAYLQRVGRKCSMIGFGTVDSPPQNKNCKSEIEMTDHQTFSGWKTIAAADAGFESKALEALAKFAIENESVMKRDIVTALAEGHFGEPWPIGQTLGPVKDRAEPSGVVLRGGKIVKTWGDVERVDMTFSISKSYLALCVGIAVDDGMIPDINEPVRNLVDDGGFDTKQNCDFTWKQLLQLTSEWEGTLWDKPDWIDHNRDVTGKPAGNNNKGIKRELNKPGTYWEYNDVRVNRISLALMRVFKRPLPEVLKERIMDPIGASDTWEWHGYENSWVDVNGRKLQSVSGGAHWGGGLWISSLDHARVGQLMLNKGIWDGKQILSEEWINACIKPCNLMPIYGYLWWLNTGDRKTFPAANSSSFFALGEGTSMIWVDPKNDTVVVVRWIQKEAIDDFVENMLQAMSQP